MENTEKPKSETVKIDGISAQINLSPGSETHRRFAQLMREAGAATARSFIETLMDAYQNPHVDTDNSEVIANLEKQIADLKHLSPSILVHLKPSLPKNLFFNRLKRDFN